MMIDFLEYDRQQRALPPKSLDYDPHLAQETLTRAWQQANLAPAKEAIVDDPSTWELLP